MKMFYKDKGKQGSYLKGYKFPLLSLTVFIKMGFCMRVFTVSSNSHWGVLISTACRDMVDFPNLLGKLGPVTLTEETWNDNLTWH